MFKSTLEGTMQNWIIGIVLALAALFGTSRVRAEGTTDAPDPHNGMADWYTEAFALSEEFANISGIDSDAPDGLEKARATMSPMRVAKAKRRLEKLATLEEWNISADTEAVKLVEAIAEVCDSLDVRLKRGAPRSETWRNAIANAACTTRIAASAMNQRTAWNIAEAYRRQ